MQVVRFDASGEILGVQQNADGSVSATADVSRCGIYEYARADGTRRRELVLPEHLFAPESLRTLGGVAVTATPPMGHPPELLNPENAGKYAVGHVHETVDAVEAPTEQDFGYVRVRLTGRTADAVKKLSQGKLYTSPGYSLPNYDSTPGIHPTWGPYDAVQGPRVYNHLALTDSPRGGDRMVVHLDAADDSDIAYQVRADARPHQEAGMIVVRLDAIGRDVQVEPLTAEVLKQELARRDADEAALEGEKKSVMDQYEGMKKELDAFKAKMDEAMGMMEKMKGEKDAAAAAQQKDAARADAAEKRLADPAELRKILAPRVALETTAREVLPKDQHARIDAMSDDEVRASTVAVLLPSLKLDGVKGDRLAGLYEGALATRQVRTDARPPARDPKAPDPQANGGKTSAELHQARTDAEYVPPRRAGQQK